MYAFPLSQPVIFRLNIESNICFSQLLSCLHGMKGKVIVILGVRGSEGVRGNRWWERYWTVTELSEELEAMQSC